MPPPPPTGGTRLPVKIELEARGGGPLPAGVERECEIKVDAYVAAVGRKPNTSYQVTQTGRTAFNDHLDALEQLIKMRDD